MINEANETLAKEQIAHSKLEKLIQITTFYIFLNFDLLFKKF